MIIDIINEEQNDDEAKLDEIVRSGPHGAIVLVLMLMLMLMLMLASIATAIVIAIWFIFYFAVFLPRGVIQ